MLNIFLILSCSGGGSTQSVEDIGDDVTNEESNEGGSGGIISEPIASFTISSYGGEAPYDITFTSTSTGDIDTYLWNIDDDDEIESTYASFTHTYENAGTYDVSLTVTGPGGQNIFSESDIISITDSNTSTQTGLLSRSMVHDNENREYLIYIPSSYSSETPIPILFAFHGFSGLIQNFINDADFRSLADQHNFIAVWPQGLVCNDGTTWNTHPPGGDNKCSQDDIGFFPALIDEIDNTYNINRDKVHLTGYSNGADFTYSMACYQSSFVTSIAPVSGLMPMVDASSECSPNHPTSLIIFNGTNDYARPYNGIDGWMMSVDETVAYWYQYNNTDASPVVTTIGDIENSSYVNGDSNTSVELFKIINGGHDWFSLNFNGENMEELMWDFFSNN